MRKLFMALFLIACNTDSARVIELEAELKECRAQSAQSNPSAPSGTMAASTEAVLPTEITVGGRVYEVLPILRGTEESITDATMVARAKEAKAHLGQGDGEHLLAHQGDIPVELQDKVAFVFTDWPHPDDSADITIVCWLGGRWVQDWDWLVNGWDGDYWVLRRHSTRE